MNAEFMILSIEVPVNWIAAFNELSLSSSGLEIHHNLRPTLRSN